MLRPVELCSLDAVHLATAQLLGAELHQVVTYDHRMAEGAEKLGLRGRAPAWGIHSGARYLLPQAGESGADVWEAVAVSLDGRVFVVAGGAGVAGEAVASGLLRQGAEVAVVSRVEQRLKAVREELDSARLHCFVGGMFDLAAAELVRDEIVETRGRIDGVIAALGGWREGPPLTQLDPAVWHQLLADNLTSHFIAARAFLPALVGRPDAVYVTLGGVGAAMPLPHAGPVSVTGAAQTRLLEVLDAERTGVRLHEVRILTPIVTRHWDRTDREPDWLTGEQVGDFLATVVSADFTRADQLILPIPEP